ncbi:hypothetical protein M8J76_005656 [Diaphorina citri]|nr:hypothetical protein M8J76_005656 [Diaphorina citri]
MSEKSNGQQAGPSSSSVQRLPTWKPPRDLSLASISSNLKASVNPAPKKQFMPNLNVQRKKNAEPTTSAKTKKDLVNTKQEKPKFTGKKKDSKGLIQTTSVFSEGIAASEKKKSSWGSYRDSEKESKANLPPPKLNLERNKTVDKSVDEETLQTLLRDDFIDDGDDKSDIKDRKAPIQLPLLKVEPKSEEDKKVMGGSSERLSQMLAECDHVSEGDVPNKFLFFQFPDSIAVSCTIPDTNKETACYSMKEINSGRLGTIQIMKSGKVRLVQGDKTYDVVSCRTDAETKTGTLASLGPITSRFIISPDWSTL